MKHFTFLFATLFSAASFAQITITSADMPTSGDTLRYSAAIIDSVSNLTFNKSGANQNWDFSQITPISQGVAQYIAGSQTPYSSTFNSPSVFGRKTADRLDFNGTVINNIFEFFSKSSSSFIRNGLGANFLVNIANTFSDPDEVYTFPLNFGNNDSTTFKLTANISIFGTLFSEGYRLNNVDSYGSITTPYGTFNCIRVQSDLVSKDSVSAIGQNIGLRSIIREYKWLAKGEPLPIMQVNGTIINGDFVPTTLIYRDNKRNVGNDLSPKAEFTINNTNPEINKDTVRIVSQSIDEGRSSYEFTFTPNNVTFVNNTSQFSPRPELLFNTVGFYTINFFVSNTNGTADSTYVNHVYATLNSSVNKNSLLESSFTVYPNPISGANYTISFELQESSNVLYEVVDLSGRRIAIRDGGFQQKGTHTIDQPISLENQTGLLFLKVHTNEGWSIRKLIINN